MVPSGASGCRSGIHRPQRLQNPQGLHLKERCPTLRAPASIQLPDRYKILEFLPEYLLGSWSKSLLAKERRQVLLDHLAVDFFYCLWKDNLHIPKDSGSSYYAKLRTRYLLLI